MIDKKYYWLNTNSRTFLARGYLSENVTPEERIKQIADNAEKILNIKSELYTSYVYKEMLNDKCKILN